MPTMARFADLPDPIPRIIADITNGRIELGSPCHVDPDLNHDGIRAQRQDGWRGALGQVGAAQTHLRNQGVAPGDVFLFWGLFRGVRQIGDRWSFQGPAHHRIFGWMQIAEIIPIGENHLDVLSRHPWLDQHPHARSGWDKASNNTIYVAEKTMTLWPDTKIHGYGVLPKGLQLTSEHSARKSDWRVPSWLDPRHGGTGLSFHPHPGQRWLNNGLLSSAGRGQEFVANIGERSDAIEWLRQLLDDRK